MLRKKIFLLFLFTPFLSFSNPIDSLKHLIAAEKNDSVKSYLHYVLSYHYLHERNFDSLLTSARRGKILAEQSGSDRNKVLNLEMEGQYFYYLALYPSAIQIFSEALALSEKLGMTHSIGRAYGMFGWIYIAQRRFKDALFAFEKSLDVLRAETYEGEYVALAYYGIASVYSYESSPLKKEFLAIQYYDSALKQKPGLEIRERAFLLAELGYVYRSFKKDSERALALLSEAERLLENDFNNLDAMAYTKAELAYLYAVMGKRRNSLASADGAKKIYAQIPLHAQIPSTYSLLSETYHLLGDESNAFEMEYKNRVLFDSIHSFRNIRLVEEVRAEYEDKKRLLEIARLKEGSALITLKAKGERTLFLVIAASAFVILLSILFVFYKRNKYKSRIAAMQVQQKIKEEKDRIAKNLHDSLGGQLSAISVGINRMVDANPESTATTIKQLVDSTLLELRNSLWDMDHESISFLELEQRVNGLFWQYRSIEVPIQLSVSIEQGLAAIKLPSEKAGHLYRLIQEATHNSIKHSHASFFRVSVQRKNQQAEIIIEDDGVGFDFAKTLSNDHHGIRNIKQRAEKLEAQLTIHSAPDHGFKITMLLPLNN